MAELIVIAIFLLVPSCFASYHEQYRAPKTCTNRWESYVFNDKEYIIHNLPVTWDMAKILCRGHHNGTLATLDTMAKSEFLAEVLSESQFLIESVWTGARRASADDPLGYRWSHGVELRRTADDIMTDMEAEGDGKKHYPMWLNRTLVPVPADGAACVALERARHDRPVFIDLQCRLHRPFVCERDAQLEEKISELQVVRCRTGLYHIYGGRMNWHQAAAYCAINKMSLANIGTMRCIKKLGKSMLKTRPSIENAWIGAKGALGKWSWIDSGLDIFQRSNYSYPMENDLWPPMRNRNSVKQSGCLQLDRHATHAPVFMEARCERKLPFICYQGVDLPESSSILSNDDIYYYVLVKQLLFWQHAYDNCLQMNGILANVDSREVVTQLLLTMGENKEEPIRHIWISGRLNMTKDQQSDTMTYTWYNPSNGKIIKDKNNHPGSTENVYMPPWLEEDFSMDNPCLNLDRQDHLTELVYGLPCDTPQYSICMIDKRVHSPAVENVIEGIATETNILAE